MRACEPRAAMAAATEAIAGKAQASPRSTSGPGVELPIGTAPGPRTRAFSREVDRAKCGHIAPEVLAHRAVELALLASPGRRGPRIARVRVECRSSHRARGGPARRRADRQAQMAGCSASWTAAIAAAAAVVPVAASVSFSGRAAPREAVPEVEQLQDHPHEEPRLQVAQQQPHPGGRDQGPAEHRLEEGAPLEAHQPAPGSRQRDVEPGLRAWARCLPLPEALHHLREGDRALGRDPPGLDVPALVVEGLELRRAPRR